jgi:hypothetical protein
MLEVVGLGISSPFHHNTGGENQGTKIHYEKLRPPKPHYLVTNPKTTTMLQLLYNVHTCDYATCSHYHHPLWDTFGTSFQL